MLLMRAGVSMRLQTQPEPHARLSLELASVVASELKLQIIHEIILF